jgi:hypothetical protein
MPLKVVMSGSWKPHTLPHLGFCFTGGGNSNYLAEVLELCNAFMVIGHLSFGTN